MVLDEVVPRPSQIGTFGPDPAAARGRCWRSRGVNRLAGSGRQGSFEPRAPAVKSAACIPAGRLRYGRIGLCRGPRDSRQCSG